MAGLLNSHVPNRVSILLMLGGGGKSWLSNIQVNSIVVPIYKTREKLFFYFGVHLNPSIREDSVLKNGWALCATRCLSSPQVSSIAVFIAILLRWHVWVWADRQQHQLWLPWGPVVWCVYSQQHPISGCWSMAGQCCQLLAGGEWQDWRRTRFHLVPWLQEDCDRGVSQKHPKCRTPRSLN